MSLESIPRTNLEGFESLARSTAKLLVYGANQALQYRENRTFGIAIKATGLVAIKCKETLQREFSDKGPSIAVGSSWDDLDPQKMDPPRVTYRTLSLRKVLRRRHSLTL